MDSNEYWRMETRVHESRIIALEIETRKRVHVEVSWSYAD